MNRFALSLLLTSLLASTARQAVEAGPRGGSQA